MDITNQENMIARSRSERERFADLATDNKRIFFRKAKVYGVLAGILMGMYLMYTGYYITGAHAGAAFAKYLILAAFLGVLLYRFKLATPSGETFKFGIAMGAITSVVSAVTTAAFSLIASGFLVDAKTIQPYFNRASGEALSSFTLAGVTLFEGFVAGMILTFICLQFLKDRRPAK